LGLVLSALLIKDQNLEENSKTYLIMLSLTITKTSRDHPQADGLAERMVQTCKKGLRKICLIGNKEDWDLALPYIAMGYMMSKHVSFFSLFSTGDIPFHPLPLLLKWTRLWTWTP
jgi:hypothetical protein